MRNEKWQMRKTIKWEMTNDKWENSKDETWKTEKMRGWGRKRKGPLSWGNEVVYYDKHWSSLWWALVVIEGSKGGIIIIKTKKAFIKNTERWEENTRTLKRQKTGNWGDRKLKRWGEEVYRKVIWRWEEKLRRIQENTKRYLKAQKDTRTCKKWLQQS